MRNTITALISFVSLIPLQALAFTGIIFTDNKPGGTEEMNTFLRDTFCTVCTAMGKEVPAEGVTWVQADKSDWTIEVSSQETVGENAPGKHFIDNDPATIWHSQWKNAKPNHPHQITIAFHETLTFYGYTYQRRSTAKYNGTIVGYEVFGSKNGTDWELLATGTFDHNALHNTRTLETPYTGSHVRLITNSSWNRRSEKIDAVYASGAEFGVLVKQ